MNTGRTLPTLILTRYRSAIYRLENWLRPMTIVAHVCDENGWHYRNLFVYIDRGKNGGRKVVLTDSPRADERETITNRIIELFDIMYGNLPGQVRADAERKLREGLGNLGLEELKTTHKEFEKELVDATVNKT